MSLPLGLLTLTRYDGAEMLVPAEMLGAVVAVEGPMDSPGDPPTVSRVSFREPCHWDTVDVIDTIDEIHGQYTDLLLRAAAVAVR